MKLFTSSGVKNIIALGGILTFFPIVQASQLAFSSPPIASSNIPMVSLDGTMRRQKSSLAGGHDTCFLATVVVNGTNYRVQV